jgi:uncharacterized protein YidB (DUF937 family)
MTGSSDLPSRPVPPTPPVREESTLDRVALERVLARAAELQAHQADVGDALTEAQLMEIGGEVGISAQNLRQALAEERGRLTLPRDEGFEGRIAGPAVAIASRTVNSTPERVMAALLHWMEREECLQVKRRFADRSTWEARRDFLSSVRRGFNVGGRGYALSRATEVGATVVPVDDGRVLVRLDADFRPARRARVIGGGATAVGGTLAGATPLVLGAAVIADPTLAFFVVSGAIATAGALGGLLGGLGIARSHRSVIERAQLALEQILDRLERAEDDAARPRLPGVLDAAERLLRETVTEIQTRSTWPRSKP